MGSRKGGEKRGREREETEIGSTCSVCGVQEKGGVNQTMRREAMLRLGEGEGNWEVLPLQGRWGVMTAAAARKMERVVGTSVCSVSAQDEKIR